MIDAEHAAEAGQKLLFSLLKSSELAAVDESSVVLEEIEESREPNGWKLIYSYPKPDLEDVEGGVSDAYRKLVGRRVRRKFKALTLSSDGRLISMKIPEL